MSARSRQNATTASATSLYTAPSSFVAPFAHSRHPAQHCCHRDETGEHAYGRDQRSAARHHQRQNGRHHDQGNRPDDDGDSGQARRYMGHQSHEEGSERSYTEQGSDADEGGVEGRASVQPQHRPMTVDLLYRCHRADNWRCRRDGCRPQPPRPPGPRRWPARAPRAAKRNRCPRATFKLWRLARGAPLTGRSPGCKAKVVLEATLKQPAPPG